MDAKRELLRHVLATVSYRGGKPLRGAPDAFATFKACDTSKTPSEILAHIGDLFDWALSVAKGSQQWRESTPLPWDGEVSRFFTTLGAFDAYLASGEPMACSAEQMFQGPIADALTHIGQLTMLRRLAGAPMRSENYFKADISVGRVGPQQTPPTREF
jgi:hypothetical protein